VKEYSSAEEFLTRGWWDDSACLILDVRLPAMGGLELQQYLAEKQPERPIVCISGRATENEQTWATMRGAVAFLRKPFSDESLLTAVGAAIARSRARLDLESEMHRNQVCPSCYESARVAEIPIRVVIDHDDLRVSTVELIKSLNPKWTEQDGLCQRCLGFYLDVGRTLNDLGSLESPSEKANGDSSATPGGLI
jgi:DNA-binding response OmpR family regulator